MLTQDLMRVQVRKGEVKPGWLDPSDEGDLERAGRLIEVIGAYEDATSGELEEALAAETGAARDFRLRRGLAKLLLDRTTIAVDCPLTPAEVRAWVFEQAAREGALTPEARDGILEAAAAHFGATTEVVEHALYADLSSNQRVGALKPITPEALIHRYNVALVQGVLLRSTGMRIVLRGPTPKRLRQLIRYLKFHRLVFHARPDGRDAWRFTVDGPASVLKHSQRYGVALANFFPALLLCEDWTLEADHQAKRASRPAVLSLSSDQGLRSHYKDTGTWTAAEEEALASRLADLAAPWQVSDSGRVYDLDGRDALVPDLVLRDPDTGAEALVEVVWRWRKGPLEGRWTLLREAGPPNLILAVCTSGQDEALPELPGAVHAFKQVPNARTLWKLAREIATPP